MLLSLATQRDVLYQNQEHTVASRRWKCCNRLAVVTRISFNVSIGTEPVLMLERLINSINYALVTEWTGPFANKTSFPTPTVILSSRSCFAGQWKVGDILVQFCGGGLRTSWRRLLDLKCVSIWYFLIWASSFGHSMTIIQAITCTALELVVIT